MTHSRYSDWQRDRIRQALQAFCSHGFSHDGRPNTWPSVSAAIENATGVRLPHERLRQYVEGTNDRKGGRHYSWPETREREDAVVAFLVDEDLLTSDELTVHNPQVQSALRLREYLQQGSDTAPRAAPRTLEGLYRTAATKLPGQDAVAVSELSLERSSTLGILHAAVLTEIFDDTGLKGGRLPTDWGKRVRARRSFTRYDGWALLTPEDNLFFFLKDPDTGDNRYYVALESDFSRDSGEPTTRLRLLEYDHLPGAPGESPEQSDVEVRAFITARLATFERDRSSRRD